MRYWLEDLYTLKGIWLYGIAFVLFVLVPIFTSIKYKQKGGRKAWPRLLAWILITTFVVGVIAVVILGQIYPPGS